MARQQTLPEDHDAQRALEQRSLRNVRALLDKLEQEAQVERKTRKRLAWVIGVVMAAALVALYALAFSRAADGNGRVIVIPATHR
jgi:fatty acid desaturase